MIHLAEWCPARFDQFALLQRGRDLPKTQFQSGEFPVAGSAGVIGFHNVANVKGPGVTVGRSGSCGTIRFYQTDFFAHNTALYVKDFFGNHPLYVAFFLEHFKPSRFKSGVSVPTLDRNQFRNEIVAVPEVGEQIQIARVLATLQQAIEQQQAIIATTRELKRSLMHKLFTEGLRGETQKPTEIGVVPESWDVVKLGECCDVVSSAIPYSDLEKTADYTGEDAVDVMGVKVSDMNLPGNELAFNRAKLERKMPPSILRKRLIAAGTIVFPKRGAAIATNKKRIASGWTVLDPNLIGVVAGERLNPDFLFHQFQRLDLRKITDPGPTPQLNKKDLLPLWLPVPKALDEQMEIATSIGAVQNKIDDQCTKLSLLNDLFKTLLYQLMTAQLRVNELDLDALGVPALD